MRFVVVYQREPHARQLAFGSVPQPVADAERVALARRTLTELDLAVDVWIDDLGDQSRRAFGDLPNWAIVVGANGVIRHKLPWADPDELALAIDDDLRWQPVGLRPAEQGFLSAVRAASAQDDAARHDRHAMLAWFVEHETAHAERWRWLAELGGDGPLRQRDWAAALLRAARDALPRPGVLRAAETAPRAAEHE